SPAHNLKAISLCPGPNLAYFSGTFSLREMVDHIYGRANLLNQLKRPHVFINELQIYLDYFKNNLIGSLNTMTFKKEKQLEAFIENLSKGISYYKSMPAILGAESTRLLEEFDAELTKLSVTVQQV